MTDIAVSTITALQSGGVIGYPTEAVYGLGCDPDNRAAVEKLLAIKQRPMAKGLILIAANYQQLMPYLDQQALQQQIMGGNVLTALAAGGMFAAPAAPTRAPYEEFMKGITYRPREAPQLAIKTPAVDYNEEAQQLLMRTRRRGMLA